MRDWEYTRDGKLMGKKACETRTAIFEGCEVMIKKEIPYREITPTSIMAWASKVSRRGQSLSTGVYYQYWSSADTLIREIHDTWMHENKPVGEHLVRMNGLIAYERRRSEETRRVLMDLYEWFGR